jgi:hypothetical protein
LFQVEQHHLVLKSSTEACDVTTLSNHPAARGHNVNGTSTVCDPYGQLAARDCLTVRNARKLFPRLELKLSAHGHNGELKLWPFIFKTFIQLANRLAM